MATRGRPKLYTGKRFEHIVELVKEHGALKTTQILRSRSDAAIAALRDKRVFPNRLSISFPTILRIAKDGGLVLSLGRRPSEVSAETDNSAPVPANTEQETEMVTG
jgi:hypothetical protein